MLLPFSNQGVANPCIDPLKGSRRLVAVQNRNTFIQTVERELLKAVRGRMSQTQLSQRLGFPFNQVYRWESGSTRISWREFVRLAELRKTDVGRPLRSRQGYAGSVEDSAALVAHLIGNLPIRAVAARTGFSPYVIRSWKSKRTKLPLSAILVLLHETTHTLPEFVSALVPSEAVPSVSALAKLREEQRRFLADHPVAGVVLHFLALPEFASRPFALIKLARKLGMSAATSASLIEAMVKAKILYATERGYQNACANLETSVDFASALKPRRYWLQKMLRVLNALHERPERTLFALTSYDVSEAALRRLREEHYQFLTRVYQILEADRDPKTRVVVQSTQLLDIEECAKAMRLDDH